MVGKKNLILPPACNKVFKARKKLQYYISMFSCVCLLKGGGVGIFLPRFFRNFTNLFKFTID